MISCLDEGGLEDETRVRTKLFGAAAAALSLFVMMGFAGWWFSSTIMYKVSSLFSSNARRQANLASAERAMWELQFGMAGFADAEDRTQAAIYALRHGLVAEAAV